MCSLRVWGVQYKKSLQECRRKPNKKYLDMSCLRVSFLNSKTFLFNTHGVILKADLSISL